MNTNLNEFEWFDESWAREAHNRTANLSRIYMVAYDAASRMSYPYDWVQLRGVWYYPRKLLIVRAFVRDAVIRHIQINLITMRILVEREFVVAHPVKEETSTRLTKFASDEAKKRRAEELNRFEEKRQIIDNYLKDSLTEFQALELLVSKYKNISNKIAGQALKLLVRISPLGVITWFAAQFQRLPDMPLLQAIILCLLWIIGYNLLGMLGIPFHDADYRKYNLFDGYMGTPSDGIRPLEPPVSRVEEEFYNQFGVKRPFVVSWEILIPVFHYVVTILMIIISVVMLPLNQHDRITASLVGFVIIIGQIYRIKLWRALIRGRYKELSFIKLLVSVLV